MTHLQQRRIRAVVLVLLLCGWAVAWAMAEVVIGSDLIGGLAWAQAGVGAVIAAWGGATATVGRYLAAKYANTDWHWHGEVARDLMVSVSVGVAGYWGGSSNSVPPMLLGLGLLLAGFLGVRILSAAADRLLSAIKG